MRERARERVNERASKRKSELESERELHVLRREGARKSEREEGAKEVSVKEIAGGGNKRSDEEKERASEEVHKKGRGGREG